ncbi:2-amino-4-hydroxy-6-hydroxymethyldihydropteridine diphosphokinase [candidate division WOR-3 bacterium]|nr:2-amino-4-hydroxy-6-hydroxymethyldihydropteridine diphosphokinase [candidate division WOR-3 bacterium]
MKSKTGIFLALGCNKGKCKKAFINVINEFNNNDIKIVAESNIYLTEPLGYQNQDDFLNMIIKIESEFKPMALLKYIKEVEIRIGREKTFKWGPRLIDIDIIIYNDIILKNDELIIPHKELSKRYFWLFMLDEIQPDMIIPGLNKRPTIIIKENELHQRMKKY